MNQSKKEEKRKAREKRKAQELKNKNAEFSIEIIRHSSKETPL